MSSFIIVILIIVLMASAVGGALYFAVKKIDPRNNDKTENPYIKTVQEFLPFESIKNNTIILPGHKYRAVIECSATNYNLKTPAERAIIEASFQRFLNSVTFPITFFLQTKIIDNAKRLELLNKEVQATITDFPAMSEYAEQYERDMADLNNKIGNNRQKKKYIIIPYDDVVLLDNLTEEEQINYAEKEIRSRCNIIMSNLESVGVTAHILETDELIELVYSCNNRDEYSYATTLADNDAFATFINGEKDVFENISKQATLDIILSETINKIESENALEDYNSSTVLSELKKMRDKYAGYYKQERNNK